MTIYFVGGEPADFTFSGTPWTISQDGTRFRTDKARCAISTTGGSGVKASFTYSNGLGEQWFGAQMHVAQGSSDATWTGDLLTWTITGTVRMILRAVTVSGVRTVRLLKVAGATETVLVTSSVAFPMALGQLATRVKWNETTGQVSVWKNETLLLNFVGNPIPSGSTGTPNGISIGCPDSASAASITISEVLISALDSRTMACYTLAPTGNGDVNQWTGSYDAVDEIEPNDADTISSNVAGRRVGFTIPVPNGLTAENRVRAVKVVARASKGDYGPGSLKIGLKQGAQVGYADTPTGLTTTPAPYSNTFLVNPATSSGFTIADLSTMQLAFETAT